MTETQIVDLWLLMKEYIDKKIHTDVAERYVTMLVDHDVSEKMLENAVGFDEVLDDAIASVMEDDVEEDDDYDDDDPWDG